MKLPIFQRYPRLSVFILSWLFFAIAGFTSWTDPPYWDTILGFMHQAVWLADHSFDYATLLSEGQGYREGGAMIYVFSVYPLWLAACLRVLGTGPGMWMLQHALQFAACAGAMTVLFELLRKRVGAWPLAAALLLVAVHPLMLAQSRCINAEPVMMLSTAGMLLALDRRRFGWLLAALLFGKVFKDFVVLPAFVFGLLGAFFIAPTWGKRLLCAGMTTVFWWDRWITGALGIRYPSGGDALLRTDLLAEVGAWLARLGGIWRHAPLVFSFAYLAALAGVVWIAAGWVRAGGLAGWRDLAGGRRFLPAASTAALLAGILLAAASNIFPPRYLLALFPCCAVVFAFLLDDLPPRLRRVPVALCALLLVLDVRGGVSRLFETQDPGNNGMILERSLEYLEDLRDTQEAARWADAQEPPVPLIAWWPATHELLRPEFGYVRRRHEVVSIGRPALGWDGVESLPEWAGKNPARLKDAAFVLTPNIFSPPGIFRAPDDSVLHEGAEGRVVIIRKPLNPNWSPSR